MIAYLPHLLAAIALCAAALAARELARLAGSATATAIGLTQLAPALLHMSPGDSPAPSATATARLPRSPLTDGHPAGCDCWACLPDHRCPVCTRGSHPPEHPKQHTATIDPVAAVIALGRESLRLQVAADDARRRFDAAIAGLPAHQVAELARRMPVDGEVRRG